MSAKPILYDLEISPPARTVKTVAKIIGVDLDIRKLDLFKGEHMEEWFLKLNPEHTVPTIDDNGVGIGDSHSISIYLIEKYAKDDKLYPKDLVKRTRVHQRLFFDASSLFVRLRDCSAAIFRGGATDVTDKVKPIADALELLETTLVDAYLTGNDWTLADISVANTILAMEIYYPVDAAKLPKVHAWLQRVDKNVPHFAETNGPHIENYRALIKEYLQKNKEQAS